MATVIRIRLGKRIRELRKRRGWKQIDFAAHAVLIKTHVSGLETGKREVGLIALEPIAKAFDMKLADLLPGWTDSLKCWVQRPGSICDSQPNEHKMCHKFNSLYWCF